MLSSNIETSSIEKDPLKRVIDTTEDSQLNKKIKSNELELEAEPETEIETEVDTEGALQLSPEIDVKEDLNQTELYYIEALENLESDSEKASDLIKIVINESDRILRQHHEEDASLFDSKFYLIFGSALFFHAQLNIKDEQEEKECLELAIDRLETSHELAVKNNETEAPFFEIKLALARAYCQKSCKIMHQADISSEVHLWSEASTWLTKASALIDEALKYILENETVQKGRFVFIEEEALGLVEFVQLLADRQCSWTLCKQWNNWSRENFVKLRENLKHKVELSLRAHLGVGSCLISLTNFYFDNCLQEEDSDSEEEEEADDNLVSLSSDMSPEIVKKYLLEATSAINKAISGLPQSDSPDNEFLARCYVLLGEAHLNLGNLFNDDTDSEDTPDDSSELAHYQQAVAAFTTAKSHHPDDLLPEAFQAFLEEWSSQLES